MYTYLHVPQVRQPLREPTEQVGRRRQGRCRLGFKGALVSGSSLSASEEAWSESGHQSAVAEMTVSSCRRQETFSSCMLPQWSETSRAW